MVGNDWILQPSTPKTMPIQKPGKSKQDYATPNEFIYAIEDRLGDIFMWDLAASADNAKAANFITQEQDSLVQPWNELAGWLWLNPPFGNIKPWVEKCWKESRLGAKIACLVPASTGANWYKEWVYRKAYTTFLNGRITFVGTSDPYPKDLMVLLYASYLEGGSCIWSWMK